MSSFIDCFTLLLMVSLDFKPHLSRTPTGSTRQISNWNIRVYSSFSPTTDFVASYHSSHGLPLSIPRALHATTPSPQATLYSSLKGIYSQSLNSHPLSFAYQPKAWSGCHTTSQRTTPTSRYGSFLFKTIMFTWCLMSQIPKRSSSSRPRTRTRTHSKPRSKPTYPTQSQAAQTPSPYDAQKKRQDDFFRTPSKSTLRTS